MNKLNIYIHAFLFITFFVQSSNAAQNNFTQEYTSIHHMELKTMFAFDDVVELAKAAGEGKLERVKELIDQGVNANFLGKKGTSPLFWAYRQNNMKGFKFLLEHASRTSYFSPSGVDIRKPIIEDACFNDRLTYLIHIVNLSDSNTYFNAFGSPLITGALRKEKEKCAKILRDGGANLAHVVKVKGQLFNIATDIDTPITMLEFRIGRYDITTWLLENGADSSVKDSNGETILDLVRIIISDNSDSELFMGKSKEKIKSNKAFQNLVTWFKNNGYSLEK